MDVLYAANDAFIAKVGISICSLFDNNKQEKEINVYILGQDISQENKNKLDDLAKQYNRNILIYPIGDIKSELNMKISLTAWHPIVIARLLIARYLPDYIQRIIYIDGDTIVRGSLSEIWEINLEGYVLGGCIAATYNNNKSKKNLIGDAPYINAGILLIDFKKWKKENIENKLLEFYAKNINQLTSLDQDVINGALKNQIYYIPPKYNFYNVYWLYPYKMLKNLMGDSFYYSKEVYDESIANPVIIHYLGEERPWRKGNHHKFKADYEKYKNMTHWKDEKDETGWETYFFFWNIFNVMTKHVPRLRYFIIGKLVPYITEYRKSKLKDKLK